MFLSQQRNHLQKGREGLHTPKILQASMGEDRLSMPRPKKQDKKMYLYLRFSRESTDAKQV